MANVNVSEQVRHLAARTGLSVDVVQSLEDCGALTGECLWYDLPVELPADAQVVPVHYECGCCGVEYWKLVGPAGEVRMPG